MQKAKSKSSERKQTPARRSRPHTGRPAPPFAVCRLPSAFFPRRRGEDASAIVYVMLTVSVLSVVAASLLFTNVSRYQTTFQSASWQESIVGAEAGVDLAMNELRRRVVTGPGKSFQNVWTTINPQTGMAYADFGHSLATADNLPYPITTHGGEGNTATQVRILVDVPGSDLGTNFAQPNDTSFISQIDNPNLREAGVDRSRWLFRIKSLGITGVSGPSRPNMNKLDNRLRHFSFFNDWRTGRAVLSPQTARLVEAVVRPTTGFRNALMADKKIDLSNQDVLIDSYDSSKGNYDAKTNHGQMGNLATNGQLINANHAVVQGNAMTNNGNVEQGENVSGQQSNSFYQELTSLTVDALNPAWGGIKDEGTVTGSRTYVASLDPNAPTLVRMDGINLPAGGNTVALNAPDGVATTTPSYIKVYVQGDIATSSDSFINVANGVNAIVYFTGNVSLQGLGIFNNSMLASHLVLNGIQPTANGDGSYPAHSISIATTQDFEGIVYAPDHDVSLALQAATGSSNSQEASKQLNKLLDDQNKAKDDWNKAVAKYQQDLSSLNLVAPPLNLVVSTVASDLSYLPAPNGQTRSDVAKLQQTLNRVAQTEVQIESLRGTLTSSQADDHARGYNGIYGGFVARTIVVAAKTHIHYDETLRTAGPVNHYEIVNWFEDDLSRNTQGGAETFWW